MMLTQERLKEVLAYDPVTGIFTNRFTRGHAVAGDVAGYVETKGYVVITLDGKRYKAQRLAWFYMTGAWPVKQVDHENTVTSYNAWDNLREANNSENKCNMGARADNKTGLKGVSIYKATGKYYAQIRKNGKVFNLGYFNCPAATSIAYQIAADKLHGEFARI